MTVVERVAGSCGELVLLRGEGHHEIVANGVFLMDTRGGASERLHVTAAADRMPPPGRMLIGGLGVGIASMVSPLYISEIAPPAARGRLVSIFQLTITIGIVAAMLANAGLLAHSLHAAPAGHGLWHRLFVGDVWRGMFLGQVVPALLFLGFALAVPESPRWLCLVGRQEDADRVLARLRADVPAACCGGADRLRNRSSWSARLRA